MRKILFTFAMLLTAFAITAQVDRSHVPKSDIPKKLDVGVLIPIEMKNGMQVYLAPVKDYPKFTITISIKQPDIRKDERIEEKSILDKAYMEKRSKKYANGEIDSLTRLKGAMLSASCFGGTIKGMNRDIELLLDMYSDLLFNPVIKEDYISEKAENYRKSQEKKNNFSVFDDEKFYIEMLTDSLLSGTTKKNEEKKEIIQDFEDIGIETVEDFLHQRVVANNAVIVIVGDFSPKACQKLMNKYFGKWQNGASLKREREIEPSELVLERRKIFVIDKPNAVQSRIRFNWIMEDAFAFDEKSVKIEVLNEILGESQLSYLYSNLREDKGLCYSVMSSLTPDDNGGRAAIWTSVRTDQTAYAIENIILEMLRIRNFDVSDYDLKVAKNSLIGDFTRSLSGIAPIPYMSFAMIKDTYNLPDDYLQTKVSKYHEVTRKDIREMAEKYIQPFRSIIIVTGKADELRGSLEQFGEVTYIDEKGKKLKFKE
ncbi:MAG: insulinase family protein [Bacteroidales bacterium]